LDDFGFHSFETSRLTVPVYVSQDLPSFFGFALYDFEQHGKNSTEI
jgi:hypothetical protein